MSRANMAACAAFGFAPTSVEISGSGDGMTGVLAVRVFTPFAVAYFFVSIFRSINAVIAPNLVRDLGLDATELGFAISAFFLSATVFQLPCGVLLDRYDPRRLYAIFLVLCALGAAFTAMAQEIFVLGLGRVLILLILDLIRLVWQNSHEN